MLAPAYDRGEHVDNFEIWQKSIVVDRIWY